jgi:hypothetical protein
MRRRPAFLAALAVLCTVAIAHLPGNAGEDLPAEKLVVVVYPVSDLPVWKYASAIKTTTDADGIVRWTQDRPDGETKFDPSLLITVIETRLRDAEGTDARIVAHETSASLVVRTTRSNHRKVSKFLESIRREFEGENHSEQKTSATLEYDDVRTSVLNTIFRAERQRSESAKNAIALIDAEIQKIASADLSDREKAPLVSSLTRFRVKILTGEYPTSDSSERSGEYEPLTQRDLDAITKLTLSQPKTVMPPDPLLQQLEAMPYKQSVHISIDEIPLHLIGDPITSGLGDGVPKVLKGK